MAIRPPAELRRAQRGGIVHRAFALLVSAALLLAPNGQAQRKDPSKGPRAVGVLVWAVDPMASRTSRAGRIPKPWIIPITLWLNQRYFDAALYAARPVPLALEPEVVYEAERAGDPQGMFTTESAGRMGSLWTADGKYKTMAEVEAARNRPKPAFPNLNEDAGPPRLRRGSDSGGKATPAPAAPGDQKPRSEPSSPTAKGESSDQPPAIKRPTSEAPSGEPRSGEAKSGEAKTSEAKSSAAAASPSSSPPQQEKPAASDASKPLEDPNAPKLAHSGPIPQQIAGPVRTGAPPATPRKPPELTGTAPSPATSSAASSVSANQEMMVAVSDAVNTESRPFGFQWNAEEQPRVRAAVIKLAQQEIASYIGKQGTAPAPAQRKAGGPQTRRAAPAEQLPPLEVKQFSGFDLDYSNYPVVVVVARQRTSPAQAAASGALPAATGRTCYATLVVRVDLNPGAADGLHKLLVAVTDDEHLDEFPRLELVDVVDADGDGIAELLFRSTDKPNAPASPWDWGFQLYRSGPDKLEKVFDSTGGQ